MPFLCDAPFVCFRCLILFCGSGCFVCVDARMLARVRVFVHRFLRVIVRLCACSRVRLHVRAPFGCEQFSHAKLVVGVKGFEPLRLTAADFKSAASAVPPHPHMRVFAILRFAVFALFAHVFCCVRARSLSCEREARLPSFSAMQKLRAPYYQKIG